MNLFKQLFRKVRFDKDKFKKSEVSVKENQYTEEINTDGISPGTSLANSVFNSSSSISLFVIARTLFLSSNSGLYLRNSFRRMSYSACIFLASAGMRNKSKEFL